MTVAPVRASASETPLSRRRASYTAKVAAAATNPAGIEKPPARGAQTARTAPAQEFLSEDEIRETLVGNTIRFQDQRGRTLSVFFGGDGIDFLYAFAQNAGLDLHVERRYGKSPHHLVEAVFKGLARALRRAVETDPRVRGAPSVKGAL